MKVKIVGFRGTGLRNPRYKCESGLVRAGHIGVIVEEDAATVYGFHPALQAEDDAGGIEGLIDRLKRHQRQPGTDRYRRISSSLHVS